MEDNVLKLFETHARLSTRKKIDGMSLSAYKTMKGYLSDYLSKYDIISRMTFTDYLSKKDLAESSKAAIASQLGKFFYWSEIFNKDDYEIIKASFRMPIKYWSDKILEEDDVVKFVIQSSQVQHHLGKVRNPLMYSLLSTIGMRATQLTEINKSDVFIDKEKMYIKIIQLKKRMNTIERQYDVKSIYISHKIGPFVLIDLYDMYVDERKSYDNEALFISEEGKRLNIVYLWKLTEKIARSMGRIDISPHTFRHYVGNRVAIKHGAFAAAALLGHSDVKTTSRYLNPATIDTCEIIG